MPNFIEFPERGGSMAEKTAGWIATQAAISTAP
jgi:hypothetical protein